MLGKVIGGGLPAAAYAGARELMERVAPAGDVYQAGTLSGNPLATAAGLATLRLLDEAAYERLAALTALLAAGLEEAAAEAGVAVQVPSAPGLLTVFFTEVPVTDYEGARACDLEAHAAFCRGAARARRLSAAVAVRGLVSLAGPHRGARRAHARGGAGGVPGVSVLAEVVAAAGPALAPHAVARPRARALRGEPFGSRRASS